MIGFCIVSLSTDKLPAGNSNVEHFIGGLYCLTRTRQSYFNILFNIAITHTAEI
jgi:hypothetical protein